ncbi:Glucose-1-phosphate adenylyltransferase [Rhodobacteraceae bacterium THAF1]|uniref:sugar phosphate nucleotidyltransferase n=1 Tax=Palleronia sp. THAF1 TaxID=2587842 RepID=UPI000F3D8702|nr:sugar phosphate nucleotidyltransferase [Palleronia sp. THAF1]QFU08415.1 Glucose-1-phosphate adenylyltransferase [Palleronia sp. THAF1]VDC29222.1 Glucose-1-phosphate adenylyltransferase [Rhodobacteraceae bacterium THAF1]
MGLSSLIARSGIQNVSDGVLPILLAGGQGSRLHELTDATCKPAVPFVGQTRIVDFTMDNVVRSGMYQILVATQYRPDELNQHLMGRWADKVHVGLRHAPDIASVTKGARGTADAVRMLIPEIDAIAPRDVVVLAADHVYRMDYTDMIADHRRSEADVTVAVDLVPQAEATAFGVLDTDRTRRITRFLEKPARPPEAPNAPGQSLASMGLYVFKWETLRALLIDHPDGLDFGHDILPEMILEGRAFAHTPADLAPFYWRDVGTLDALRHAALDFMGPDAPFPLPDQSASSRRDCQDSLIMQGAFVSKGSILQDCIVAPGAVIPFGTMIGMGFRSDADRFRRTEKGTWLVTPEMLRRGNP